MECGGAGDSHPLLSGSSPCTFCTRDPSPLHACIYSIIHSRRRGLLRAVAATASLGLLLRWPLAPWACFLQCPEALRQASDIIGCGPLMDRTLCPASAGPGGLPWPQMQLPLSPLSGLSFLEVLTAKLHKHTGARCCHTEVACAWPGPASEVLSGPAVQSHPSPRSEASARADTKLWLQLPMFSLQGSGRAGDTQGAPCSEHSRSVLRTCWAISCCLCSSWPPWE